MPLSAQLHRAPAWTDRLLCRVAAGQARALGGSGRVVLSCERYDAADVVESGAHAPVYGALTLNMD